MTLIVEKNIPANSYHVNHKILFNHMLKAIASRRYHYVNKTVTVIVNTKLRHHICFM